MDRLLKSSAQRELLCVIVIFIVCCGLYSPVFQAKFLTFDDMAYVYQNEAVVDFKFSELYESLKAIFKQDYDGVYTPLVTLGFALENQLYGMENPGYWHGTNLIIHLACSILCFFIGRQLRLSIVSSLIMSLFFAIHPMRVESVAWLTERKDVQYGFFYFLGMFIYLKHGLKNISLKIKVLVVISFLLAFFSKAMAISFPLTILLIDYLHKSQLGFSLVVNRLWIIIPALLCLVFTLFLNQESHFQRNLADMQLGQATSRALLAHGSYMMKFVYPDPLVPDYAYPRSFGVYQILKVFLGMAPFILLVYSYVKKWKWLFFGLGFYLINLVVPTQVIMLGFAFGPDRFTYVAYFGLIFIFAYWLNRLLGRQPKFTLASIGIISIICIFWGIKTFSQSCHWRNNITLWDHQLSINPNSSLAHVCLARHFEEQGNKEMHLNHLTQALAINPNHGHAVESMAELLYDNGQYSEAMPYLNQVIKSNQSPQRYLTMRGISFDRLGYPKEALEDLNQAVLLNVDKKRALLYRSNVLRKNGDFESALIDLNYLTEIDPANAGYWMLKSILERQTQKVDRALESINQAISLDSADPSYFHERALTYGQLGLIEQAKDDLNAAMAMGFNNLSDEAIQIVNQ